MTYDFALDEMPEEEEGDRRLAAYTSELAEVVARMDFGAPEAALASLYDEEALSAAEDIALEFGRVRHVIVIGIGGSSVGTEAVYRALERDDSPLLHTLDVLDLEHVDALVALCRKGALEDFVICIISKSGSTTETLANADVLLSALAHTFGDELWKRVCTIGDDHTALCEWSMAHGVEHIIMPTAVGGRFSVFTVVGLVPLALLRVPVREFVRGGRDALTSRLSITSPTGGIRTRVRSLLSRTTATHTEGAAGAPLRDDVGYAALRYAALCKSGHIIQVFFAEHERLVGCAKWCEQLFAESLGKEHTKDGGAAHVRGMAPIVMTPRELHSTAQLYLSGHKSTYTIFLGRKTSHGPGRTLSPDLGARITMHEPRIYERIAPAIMDGVHEAYREAQQPHTLVTFEAIEPYEIGQFMAERMLEVMYIANLLSLNAFDQPHVELYKRATRAILTAPEPQAPTAKEEGVYVLFDIGGTKTRVAVTTDLTTIEASVKFPTPEECAKGIVLLVEEALRMLQGRKATAVAGDIRGMLTKEKDALAFDSVLTDWMHKPLCDELSRAFDAPVYLENDAALCGLGEAHFGAGKGFDIVAYHTVSTGVGGARIVHGEIDAAHSGFEPGKQLIDIDHTVHPELGTGTLEELISGAALERRTGRKPYENPQTDVALWDELATYFAYGLRNTIVYWAPDVIVIGGSMIVGDPRILREDILKHLKEILGEMPCPPILDATLKDEGGLFGAMALLRQKSA